MGGEVIMDNEDKTNPTRRGFIGGVAVSAGAVALAGGAYLLRSNWQRLRNGSSGTPAPMRDVAGKVAFITGGSSGIGLAQAQVFHEAGMRVAIGYIRDDQLDTALAKFTTDRDRVLAIKANVTDRDAMKAAADEIESHFGGIHLVSNNAGITLISGIEGLDPRSFDQCIAVNLTGVFNGIHEFLPRIRRHGQGGQIIATSSMGGLMALGAGGGAYVASKFGIVGLMEALRAELDGANAGIGVSVFCPGPVNTRANEIAKNLSASFKDQAAIPSDVAADEEFIKALNPKSMDPVEAARIVLDGVRHNDLYILSHPEFAMTLHERHEALEASEPTGASGGWDKPLPSMYAAERDRMMGRRRK
jgi:NAD(P)-dependent dehydrogenase (short-subunit alcohol dehydrogenase family)